ncbi:MAG: aldo/keto reductase, partial [Anaerolineae bacterium]
MSQVERFELRPNYSISRVIKGGWQLSGDHGDVNQADAVRDMLTFVDAGITTFDCADIYTGVEAMIGEFVDLVRQERGQSAVDKIKVHTKFVPDYAQLDS